MTLPAQSDPDESAFVMALADDLALEGRFPDATTRHLVAWGALGKARGDWPNQPLRPRLVRAHTALRAQSLSSASPRVEAKPASTIRLFESSLIRARWSSPG
jgi:hypothetical protein